MTILLRYHRRQGYGGQEIYEGHSSLPSSFLWIAICSFRHVSEEWWQGADLNRRPKAYESSALPLSYTAIFRVSAIGGGEGNASSRRICQTEDRGKLNLAFAGGRHDNDAFDTVF